MDQLDNKTMIEILPEFRYTLGDMRQHLYDYMLSLSKFSSFHDQVINGKNSYLHACIKDKEQNLSQRSLRPPSPKYFSLLKQKIAKVKDTSSFIVIPIFMKNKFACYSGNEIQKNISKHLIFALYNRKTHELERIDIKKYHIQHFFIKPIYKQIKSTVLQEIQKIDPECTFVQEHDVPVTLFKQLKDSVARNIYPMFVITYLHVRNSYPSLKSSEILDKINSFDRSKFVKYWKHYVKFCKKYYKFEKCAARNLVDNFETERCINVRNKMFIESRWNKPVVVCKSKQKFSNILKKCVHPKQDEEVNIFLDILTQIELKQNNKFKRIGTTNAIVNTIQYIIHKHNNAHVLFPQKNKLTRLDICLSWIFNKQTQKHEFIVPNTFKEMWQTGLNDDNSIFLIVLCHIQSIHIALHANVLIYDKRSGELERFDSLGAEIHPFFNMDDFDAKIEDFFVKGGYIEKKEKYFMPIDYCPNLGLYQAKEMDEIGFVDDSGNCAVWRAFYIDMRLANPTMTRVHLIKYSLKQIENYGSFQKFIKSYQHYLTDASKKKNIL